MVYPMTATVPVKWIDRSVTNGKACIIDSAVYYVVFLSRFLGGRDCSLLPILFNFKVTYQSFSPHL